MYLAIDIGTSGCKVALSSGKSFWTEKYGLEVIREGLSVEQDPNSWLEALSYVIPRVLGRVGKGGVEIRGISVSSHSPSLVPVDEQGDALRPCLIWQDRRAQDQADHIRLLTGKSTDATSFDAKMLWVQENEPEVFERTKAFLQPKDFVIYHLTGHMIMDSAAACWLSDREGIAIDRTKVPQIVHNWEIVAETSETARRFGLVPGIPVVAGGIDVFCETLGAGLIEDGQLGDVTGTSTCLMYCLDETNCKSDTLSHVVPQRGLSILTMSLTGGALSWFMNHLGQELQFEEIDDLVAQSPPGAKGLVFLPYLAGERSPLWDAEAKGMFFGITASHTKADFLRAVLEGSAFAVRHNLDILRATISIPREMRATGGGGRLACWNQIKADITGLTYQRLHTLEGALLGGILLAMHAVEGRPFGDLVAEFVRVETNFTPQSSPLPYDDLFYRYKELYTCTYELMRL